MDEHDYKKMIRFMKKSLKSFRKEAVQITKPFIDNIDFLIVNFPYFAEIEMVSEYFMTQNEEFNHVFTTKFHTFAHILFYNPENIPKNDYYDNVSINKLKLWNGVLGRSGREKLKRFWVRIQNTYDTVDNDIYTLNDKDMVLMLFFNIINFHYKQIKGIILDHLDIQKVLENLHVDDSLMLKLLDSKHENIFQGIENVSSLFITAEKFTLLEKYYEKKQDCKNDALDLDKLLYLFLTLPNYLDYKTIYNILKLKATNITIYADLILRRKLFVYDGEFVCSETKYMLYVSLLSKNSIELTIKTPEVCKYLSDIWFSNPESAFLVKSIFDFMEKSKLFENVKNEIEKCYRDGKSESFKHRPKTNTLYSYCKRLLQKNKLDLIKYSQQDKINEYIDQCFDESFMRYICKLVIDEVPVLNIYKKSNL